MQSGESIYNLIPPPEVQQARPRMHKSQHPGTVDPAKFGLGPRRATATFGRAPGEVKPETSKFLKKNTGVLNATLNTRASPTERISRGHAFRAPHGLRAATENHAMFQNRPHRFRARRRFPRVRRRTRRACEPRLILVFLTERRLRRRFRSPRRARHSSTRAVADLVPPPSERRSEIRSETRALDASSSVARKRRTRRFSFARRASERLVRAPRARDHEASRPEGHRAPVDGPDDHKKLRRRERHREHPLRCAFLRFSTLF